jgi:hypothetical protein
MTYGRDPSICYNLSGQSSHKLHYFKLDHLYLEVVLGSTKYHHQDSGIPRTGIRLILLDHGSMVDERGPSFFIINFPDSLPMNFTTLRLGLPRRGIRKYKILSPG